MKILHYTSALEQSTFRKTARMLKKAGAKVSMIGFYRGHYPHEDDGIIEESFGNISNGKYITRIIKLFKIIKVIRYKIDNEGIESVVCLSMDSLLLVSIALFPYKDIKIVYQVEDIRSILIGKKIKTIILRWLERKLLKNVSVLLITSQAYYEHHYKKYYSFPDNKVLVIENKVEDSNIIYSKKNNISDGKIVIGYFGVLRCKRTWEILKQFAIRYPNDYKINLWGKPDAISDEDLSNLPESIEYFGRYSSPGDLSKMYENVNIVFAAYPYGFNRIGNWMWARTVRFYESCAFGRPVIVQENTQDSFFVKKFNIGISLAMDNVTDAVECMYKSITKKNIRIWSNELNKLDKECFIHKDEYQKLLERLMK